MDKNNFRGGGIYARDDLSAMQERAMGAVIAALGFHGPLRRAATLSNDGYGLRIDVVAAPKDLELARERLAPLGRSYGAVRIFLAETK